jgi:2,3-bisphosphoglycerate-dependent phosphoglycerate mutase
LADEEYSQRPFIVPPDATEVVLVRHGASAPIRPGEQFPTLDSHGDPALAPEGVAQAELVAARLRDQRIDAVFVTGLARTIQTAEALGRPTTEIPELREIFLGEWEGGEFRVRISTGDPLAMRVITEQRWDVIPGAETMEAFAARVRAGLEKVSAATGPGNVAAVFAHGGVIGEACRQATGSEAFAFVINDNCAITRLVRFANGRWLLRSFNDTAHLAASSRADGGSPMVQAAASGTDDRQVSPPR